MHEVENKSNSLVPKLKVALLVLVLVGATGIILSLMRGEQELVVRDPSTYQAVFLDNEQVYFGKLKAVNQDFWSLTDIYYLRAGVQLQSDANSQIDLIKLGAELHQPRDEMIINKDHVIFYEDIGKESEVSKLIDEHKKN